MRLSRLRERQSSDRTLRSSTDLRRHAQELPPWSSRQTIRVLRQTMRRFAPDVVHANLTSMRSCRAAIFAALTLRLRSFWWIICRCPVFVPGSTAPAAPHPASGRAALGRVELQPACRADHRTAPGSVRTIHNGVPTFAHGRPHRYLVCCAWQSSAGWCHTRVSISSCARWPRRPR